MSTDVELLVGQHIHVWGRDYAVVAHTTRDGEDAVRLRRADARRADPFPVVTALVIRAMNSGSSVGARHNAPTDRPHKADGGRKESTMAGTATQPSKSEQQRAQREAQASGNSTKKSSGPKKTELAREGAVEALVAAGKPMTMPEIVDAIHKRPKTKDLHKGTIAVQTAAEAKKGDRIVRVGRSLYATVEVAKNPPPAEPTEEEDQS